MFCFKSDGLKFASVEISFKEAGEDGDVVSSTVKFSDDFVGFNISCLIFSCKSVKLLFEVIIKYINNIRNFF